MSSPSITASIGYQFQNPGLLRQALTHRSYAAHHNERLEFLGDAVLNCVVAAELYCLFPTLDEGELSRLRASLVKQGSLHEIAQRINLGSQLVLGEGELKSGGATRPSILADAVEALIGAVFIDSGFAAARDIVLRLFESQLQAIDPSAADKDAKTALQEYLQARHIPLPRYSVTATAGEAHGQTFHVDCQILELNICTQGEGLSRRSAEQMAAQRAFELVNER